MNALELLTNKRLRLLEKVNCKIQKLSKEKKSPFMIYADFKSILVPKDSAIIVISLGNIEALHIEIIKSRLSRIIKLLLYFTI